MSKYKFFLLLRCFLLLLSSPSLSQTDTPCGVPDMDPGLLSSQPWHNDPAYFERMLDSLAILGNGGGALQGRNETEQGNAVDDAVIIPIKFWWYRENDPGNRLSYADIEPTKP
jgi:hypothetical protein